MNMFAEKKKKSYFSLSDFNLLVKFVMLAAVNVPVPSSSLIADHDHFHK